MCQLILTERASIAETSKVDGCEYSIASIGRIESSSSGHTETNADGLRLLVRPFQLSDAPLLYEATRESIEQLRTWMTWCRADYSLTDAEFFVSTCARAWDKGEHFSFAIIDRQTGALLGSAGLNHLNSIHRFANLGYWIRTGASGRGVATAAIPVVAEFGLTKLGLERLELLIPESNFASQRVAQKIGATFEGDLRERLIIAGKRHDAVMYSLVWDDLNGVSNHGSNESP